jgi:hypothetical protein
MFASMKRMQMKKINWEAEKRFVITVTVLFLISGLLIFDAIGAKKVTFRTFWGAVPSGETLYTYTALLGVIIALFTLLAIVTRIYESWL